ncbi:MAG: DUF898 domain-containing protein [Alphaproteobacteria bacterium]|nr:DUF898 domain-containing protein [Alphaproteobacteria bacterium]
MENHTLKTDYAGKRGALFKLAIKTSLLTVLTLGIYRFWMKTRLRRFYWSAIRPGGIPLEYTGTGVEKLMGFLIAVVFLSFYIGIVNLLLVFVSFSLINSNLAAYALSFVGLIPIYFYAQYRARRYVLARTRWRTMRFGIEAAAWPYAWRAMLHWLATILTLGLLLPRQIFWLEKFRIDRTWFGDQKFTQEGRWTQLLPIAIHMYIGIGLTIAATAGLWISPASASLFLLSVPWLFFGFVHFQIQSFRFLARQKRLGANIRFVAEPRTWRVIRIYIFGGLLIWLSVLAVLVGLGLIVGLVVSRVGPEVFSSQNLQGMFADGTASKPLVVAASIIAYFAFFIFSGVLVQIFITMPKLAHYARTLRVLNTAELALIRQRPRDEMSSAEGFAEALDIGAAI